MKLGVNLWTIYGWQPPETITPDVIRKLAELGCDGVELVIDEAFNSAELWLENQDRWKALFNDQGVEIPSVASTLFWKYNLASQDNLLREHGIKVGRDGCEVAKAFGAQVMLIVAGIQEPNTEYKKSYDTAVETIRTMANFAADLGIILGVENVPSNFLCSPGEFSQFISDINHPSVKTYLDFANGASIGRGYPENWIKAVDKNMAMIHAKDYDQNLNAFVSCGQGDLNWDDVFNAIYESEYNGYLIVETPPRGGRDQPNPIAGFDAADSSLKWLSRYIQKS